MTYPAQRARDNHITTGALLLCIILAMPLLVWLVKLIPHP